MLHCNSEQCPLLWRSVLEWQYQQPGQDKARYIDQESNLDCKDGTGHGSWAEYIRFLADDTHSLRS